MCPCDCAENTEGTPVAREHRRTCVTELLQHWYASHHRDHLLAELGDDVSEPASPSCGTCRSSTPSSAVWCQRVMRYRTYERIELDHALKEQIREVAHAGTKLEHVACFRRIVILQ